MTNEQTAPFNQFKTTAAGVSWRQQLLDISGNALKSITFLDTSPNMFMLQNPTGATLYIGISSTPTPENYEFKVLPNTSKLFGRPVPVKELFIYNISNADVTVNLFSVLDKFDLSILSDSTVRIDENLASEIKGDGICKGFSAGVSIPRGDNLIGKVDINNMPTMALPDAIQTSLDALKSDNDNLILGSERNGYTNLATVAKTVKEIRGGSDNTATLSDIVTGLNEVKTALGLVNSTVGEVRSSVNDSGDETQSVIGQEFLSLRGGADNEKTLADVVTELCNVKVAVGMLSNTMETYVAQGETDRPIDIFTSNGIATFTAYEGHKYNLLMFTNDGADIATMTITRANVSNPTLKIKLKAGESVGDFKLPPMSDGDTITFPINTRSIILII